MEHSVQVPGGIAIPAGKAWFFECYLQIGNSCVDFCCGGMSPYSWKDYMARKNKKNRNRKQKNSSLNTLSLEELWEQASSFLQRGKYQDAIKYFKQLLKIKESQEVVRGLEQAYVGRIESLAAKGMTKESLALLDTLTHRFPNAQVGSLRLSLLLQAERYSEAARLFGKSRDQLEANQIIRLETVFGALLLANVDLQADDFDSDSPVVRHYSKAQQALEFFWNGMDSKARDALQHIPFRSPYRDVRTLLSGLLRLAQEPDNGRVILEKIPDESPYFRYAARFLAAYDTPDIVLEKLRSTSRPDRKIFYEYYGLAQGQARALDALANKDNSPLSLYDVVSTHNSCFERKHRIELLKNILPFCGTNAGPLVLPHAEFDHRQKIRICALAAEQDGAFSSAVEIWDEYLEGMDREHGGVYKELAMIRRRQAAFMERDLYAYGSEKYIEYLEESLKYDPGHAETWLKAAKYAKRYVSLNRAYSIINEAVENLPENVTILVEAMKACGERNAHKKAAGLAKRVLHIDPINTSALDFQVEAHLEHGRKLATQKKWALAEKEVRSADTRVKALRLLGRYRICQGMLFLLQNKEEGDAFIEQGREENGFPVLSHVLTSLEARLYKLPKVKQKKFDQELRKLVGRIKQIDVREFNTLIGWMLDFTGKQYVLLKDICPYLKTYFSRAAGMDWKLEEGLSICRALERVGNFSALAQFSKRLLKQFPDSAEVRVYQLEAMYGDGRKAIPENVFSKMDKLSDELFEREDYELLDRLENILNQHLRIHGRHYEDEFDEFDEFDALFEELFKIPQKKEDPPKKKPTPKLHQPKQLNLFDEEL